MITECCVCRNRKDKDGKYYSPSAHERREVYFFQETKISHGYCPTCSELQQLKDEGLIKLVKK